MNNLKFGFDMNEGRIEWIDGISGKGYARVKVDGDDFDMYTDEAADDAVKDYISDSICYFNTDFLADHMTLPRMAAEVVINALRDNENNNAALKDLLVSWNEFVEDAILADGRAHFLNTYDGEEYQLSDFNLDNLDLPEELFDIMEIDKDEELFLYRV